MRKKFIGGDDGFMWFLIYVGIPLVIISAILYGLYKLFKEKLGLSTTVSVILLIISFFALIFLAFALNDWYKNRKLASTTN